MDYLIIKEKPTKIKIIDFNLNFETGSSPVGSGGVTGIVKVKSFEFYLMGSDIHLFQIFTHYPNRKLLPQISIFRNSKIFCEFYECYVMTVVSDRLDLFKAKLEFQKLKQF